MNTLKSSVRLIVTLAFVCAAFYVGRGLWVHYMDEPWTRDARLRADVVGIAPDVSGLVSEVDVQDNQRVKKGDVLFRVDRERFNIALAQAEAALEGSRAAMEQAHRERERQERLGDAASLQQKDRPALRKTRHGPPMGRRSQTAISPSSISTVQRSRRPSTVRFRT